MFVNVSLDFLITAKSLEGFCSQKSGYDQQGKSIRLTLS